MFSRSLITLHRKNLRVWIMREFQEFAIHVSPAIAAICLRGRNSHRLRMATGVSEIAIAAWQRQILSMFIRKISHEMGNSHPLLLGKPYYYDRNQKFSRQMNCSINIHLWNKFLPSKNFPLVVCTQVLDLHSVFNF